MRTDNWQIKDLVVELQRPQAIEAGVVIPLALDEPDTLMRDGTTLPIAKLPPKTAAILRNLMALCDLQLFYLEKAHGTKVDYRRKGSKQARAGIVYVNIYGSRDMADGVGEFFTQCGMNLQDPEHCDRDVLYYNPHILWNDEELVTTLSLASTFTAPDIEQIEEKPDLFELLRSEELLLETDTPAILSTTLHR